MPPIKCLCHVGVLAAQSASNAATPRSAFVDVAGVRLHYLDWGGSGELSLPRMSHVPATIEVVGRLRIRC